MTPPLELLKFDRPAASYPKRSELSHALYKAYDDARVGIQAWTEMGKKIEALHNEGHRYAALSVARCALNRRSPPC